MSLFWCLHEKDSALASQASRRIEERTTLLTRSPTKWYDCWSKCSGTHRITTRSNMTNQIQASTDFLGLGGRDCIPLTGASASSLLDPAGSFSSSTSTSGMSSSSALKCVLKAWLMSFSLQPASLNLAIASSKDGFQSPPVAARIWLWSRKECEKESWSETSPVQRWHFPTWREHGSLVLVHLQDRKSVV